MEAELARLTADIHKEAGQEFNINSPQQVAAVLRAHLEEGRLVKRTPKGKVSTRAELLLSLAREYPLAQRLLEYRDCFKILTTYVKPFEELRGTDGRLHTDYVQTGTATGRLSSRAPNLQNIPQDSVWASPLRGAFRAPPGRSLLAFDYSQIELRIVASLSEDPRMREAFAAEEDIHRVTASRLFERAREEVTPEMRRLAKTLNFGLIYGMGAAAFARTSGLTREEAKKFIDAYFKEFSKVGLWQEEVRRFARTFGYVETLTGRRRNVLQIGSASQAAVAEAERAAVNHPVQGLSADIMKLAMIRASEALARKRWWGEEAKMVLTIHDELLFEVAHGKMREVAGLIARTMEEAFPLRVPLTVAVRAGENWGALSPFDFEAPAVKS
jgi:DNA polymerase-1